MASLHLIDKAAASAQAAKASSPNNGAVFDQNISHVPEKFKGTSADQQDMAVLGKKQVLRVRLFLDV
jgi:hypothetical protein